MSSSTQCRPAGGAFAALAGLTALLLGLCAAPAGHAAGLERASGGTSGGGFTAAAGEINIVASHSGRCVEVENSSVQDGAAVLQTDCTGQTGAVWRLEESAAGGGTVNVVNANSGKCLEMQGAAVGSVAKQAPCSGQPQVSFTMVDRTTHVWLQPRSTTPPKCLEVASGSHTSGAAVRLAECSGQSGIGFHQRAPQAGNDAARDPQGGVERVNVKANNGQSTGIAPLHFGSAVSADGRFTAFESMGADLVTGDTNTATDVFVRDRVAKTVQRVSVSSTGAQGDKPSTRPAISADGRYVAFDSASATLTLSDANNTRDVFVRDRQTGLTELMSRSAAGATGTLESSSPSISPDGRYVAFLSRAGNLVPGDANNATDVFVRDRLAGTIERIVLDNNPAAPGVSLPAPLISEDGRYVAFMSASATLVPGDTTAAHDVYVRDRQNGTTERISQSASGAEGTGDSVPTGMSPNGRHIAFHSTAANLVPGDTNGVDDVFVRDRQSGATERISVGFNGAQTAMSSREAAISSDGRYVAFTSDADTLVQYDNNSVADVFVRDRAMGYTVRASINDNGVQGNNESRAARISANGDHVAFHSTATNLLTGDTNTARDVFLRPRPKA